MKKAKMISKGCPDCDEQVPVASKTCRCGHVFNRRGLKPHEKATLLPLERRRTERVNREKPAYYDSLEYEKKLMPRSLPKSGTSSAEERDDFRDELDFDDDDGPDTSKLNRRFRRIPDELPDDEDEDSEPYISPEKAKQYAVILDEINRKIISASWKPND